MSLTDREREDISRIIQSNALHILNRLDYSPDDILISKEYNREELLLEVRDALFKFFHAIDGGLKGRRMS